MQAPILPHNLKSISGLRRPSGSCLIGPHTGLNTTALAIGIGHYLHEGPLENDFSYIMLASVPSNWFVLCMLWAPAVFSALHVSASKLNVKLVLFLDRVNNLSRRACVP